MQVEKRDGTLQEFDFQKITQAVKNVYKSIGKEGPEKVMFDLCEYYRKLSEKYDSGKNTQPIPTVGTPAVQEAVAAEPAVIAPVAEVGREISIKISPV